MWFQSEYLLLAGLHIEPAAQGDIQASHDQLLGADLGQPDPEHHPLQAGQETQGTVWTSHGLQDCEEIPTSSLSHTHTQTVSILTKKQKRLVSATTEALGHRIEAELIHVS